MQESSSNWPFHMMVGWAGRMIGMNRPSVGDTSPSGVPAPTAPQYNLDTPTTPVIGNKSSSNQPFHMTGRGGSQIGGVNQPFAMGTSQSGIPTPSTPQYNLDTPTTPDRGNGQSRKRARPQDDPNDANDAKKRQKQTKKRPYCGKCIGCLEKEDCGICANCKDKPKSGGPGTKHARCIKRQCQKLKYGPKEETSKNVGKCVAATKSGAAGRNQATGNPKGARNWLSSQTTENGGRKTANLVKAGDSKDSSTNGWSFFDVSEDDEQKDQSAGDQQQQQQQQQQKQQLQIGDLTVQLNHCLGYGSFGTVYNASYQGTPVAAKYLYRPVCDYESFKHTLEDLQGLIHPNLVAYRAAAMGPIPRTSRPILVMELMEKSLTKFLEEAENDIPIHLQVNLCLDITFALVYLHSHQIVHGKLSSNNVLLVGTTAKVADFGMSKLLDSQSSVTQPASCLPPEARVTHSQCSEKSDVFSFGMLVVQIVSREAPAPTPQQQLAPLSKVDRRQQHIQKIASAHPLRDIAIPCLRKSAMDRPTVKKVLTKLSTVKYHSQYVASLKQEREKVQQEIAQLKEKPKLKEEFALKEKQENETQMGLVQQKIAQLQAELKSKEEFTQKQKQESEKQKEVLLQQLKERDQKIASIRLTFGKQHQTVLALKKEVEVKSTQVQDRNKQILKQSQESEKQVGLAQREIVQLKGELKSREELALKERQESEKQMEKLQQQLKEKDQKITTVQTAYGMQHQALLVMTSKLHESEGALALRKELEEKVQDKEKQIQACEMEVKNLLQQSQKKDIKISELEAWKKTIKDKITSLASAAEQ